MNQSFKKWVNGEASIADKEVKPYERKEVVLLDKHVKVDEKNREVIDKRVIRINKIAFYILSLISVLLFLFVILTAISWMPVIGEALVPAWNSVAQQYVIRSLNDTKAINAVTGMILDYRAFDTLGESFVLFTAVSVVFILLKDFKSNDEVSANKLFDISKDPIVRFVSAIVICIVFMFGVYVILNGHISPGGGFSGGALIGAALVLFSIAYGDEIAHKFFNEKTFKVITSCALLGYCLTKAYSFFVGGMGLHTKDIFGVFPIGSILSGGFILILNICVGLVVSCTIYGFYCLFKKGEI